MSIPKRLRAVLALLVVVAFAVYGFLPAVSATGNASPKAEAAPAINYCAGDFSPGYWKNYQNHYTDTQFYALLQATTDFGTAFTAADESAAISQAETILKLKGYYYVRSLLTAELNAAATAGFGGASFNGQTTSINQDLTAISSANGSGNSSPYANGNLTQAQQNELAYLSGGGEQDSANGCQITPSTATATPTTAPTNTPTGSHSATATPTSTPTSTPTNVPTNTPGGTVTNFCAGDFSPGYWKNYQNHYMNDQFYALLTATVDFGATFTAEGESAAISQAETILKLQGFYYVRSLLTAELNAANTAGFGGASYNGQSTTVSQDLSAIYAANGSGNSSPYTNGNLTQAQQNELDYLSGGGEQDSANGCLLTPSHATATPTSTPTTAPTNTPTATPTDTPTSTPTTAPTDTPTPHAPTATPTTAPTDTPTPHAPTSTPTTAPTDTPTAHAPTSTPTNTPTDTPTATPTNTPTQTPTTTPTSTPHACANPSSTISGTYQEINSTGQTGYPSDTVYIWLLDQSGNPVTSVSGSNGGPGYAVVSTTDGSFSFTNVPAGSYILREGVDNTFAATSMSLNGTPVAGPGVTDLPLTIGADCGPVVGITVSQQTCNPPTLTSQQITTAPDGHKAVVFTVTDASNGGGLQDLQLTGNNFEVYEINGQAVSPQPIPYTLTFSAPLPTSITVGVEKIDNSNSAQITINSTNSAGCTGDPASAMGTRSTGQPSTTTLHLLGTETTITVMNVGVTTIQLTLGDQQYQLVADNGAPGWSGNTYHIASNGNTTLPMPTAALGSTTATVTDVGKPGGDEFIMFSPPNS